MTDFSFDGKEKEGAKGAEMLDEMFRRKGFTVDKVRHDIDKSGTDRIFTLQRLPIWKVRVEYKTDVYAANASQKNFYAELVSCVSVKADGSPDWKTAKQGWTLKCSAEILVYYLPPPTDDVYLFAVSRIRDCVFGWYLEYGVNNLKERFSKENGRRWATWGFPVPLKRAYGDAGIGKLLRGAGEQLDLLKQPVSRYPT